MAERMVGAKKMDAYSFDVAIEIATGLVRLGNHLDIHPCLFLGQCRVQHPSPRMLARCYEWMLRMIFRYGDIAEMDNFHGIHLPMR